MSGRGRNRRLRPNRVPLSKKIRQEIKKHENHVGPSHSICTKVKVCPDPPKVQEYPKQRCVVRTFNTGHYVNWQLWPDLFDWQDYTPAQIQIHRIAVYQPPMTNATLGTTVTDGSDKLYSNNTYEPSNAIDIIFYTDWFHRTYSAGSYSSSFVDKEVSLGMSRLVRGKITYIPKAQDQQRVWPYYTGTVFAGDMQQQQFQDLTTCRPLILTEPELSRPQYHAL